MQIETAIHDEKGLFAQISEGSEPAFRSIFLLYGKLLFPFLYRICKSEWTAEELIQETLLRVWLNRDKLPDIENPRAWIFKIAANLAYTQLKKRLREEVYAKENGREESETATEESVHLKRLKECVKEAIERMPDQRKLIYQLSRDRELTRAEIAAQLNISEKTVKNSLNAALKSIREHLQTEGYVLSLILIIHLR